MTAGIDTLDSLSVRTMTIATSIAPSGVEKQSLAVDSWRTLGFKVISVNQPSEIIELKPLFPGIQFVPANRVATELTGKPLVYLDDLLAALHASGADICGIVNSDIILQNMPDFPDFLRRNCPCSFIYGPRLDVDSVQSAEGSQYQCGRDYFFFERELIARIPASEMIIGAPWWDIWLPLVAEHAGKHLIQPLDWIALHVRHPVAWNQELFWDMSLVFLDLISVNNLNVQQHPSFHTSSELIRKHRSQNAMLQMLYNFLAEKTLILPISSVDIRQLTATVTLLPAEYSLIFPYLDGRDIEFIFHCILELELLSLTDNNSIELVIIIEGWHDNSALYESLMAFTGRFNNITCIRMLTCVDKQSALDAASRFTHGTKVISLDSVLPYSTADADETTALRNYYNDKFHKLLDRVGLHHQQM